MRQALTSFGLAATAAFKARAASALSIACMASELSLFGDELPQAPGQPVPRDDSIPDWLVEDIRAALTALGLTTMAERQRAIEAAVERPVESLRALTRAEALRVMASLRSPSAPTDNASSWDNRDEDTWIDRL
jgi:hypothetical protein